VNLETAAQQFGVKLPIERATLKKLFREAAKRLHTDTSGEDTKEAFILMKSAYDFLCDENLTGVFTDGPELLTTEEGTPLSYLGLGLGPMKNSKTCDECKGAGYRTDKRWKFEWTPSIPCSHCLLMGTTIFCGRCGPKGIRRIDKKVTVYMICAPCQGTGEIELFNPVIPKGLLAAFAKR
jgi:DnaJ-class molecular chaperone